MAQPQHVVEYHAIEQGYDAGGNQVHEVGDKFGSVEEAALLGLRARPVVVEVS
jgi:hypothetical protein